MGSFSLLSGARRRQESATRLRRLGFRKTSLSGYEVCQTGDERYHRTLPGQVRRVSFVRPRRRSCSRVASSGYPGSCRKQANQASIPKSASKGGMTVGGQNKRGTCSTMIDLQLVYRRLLFVFSVLYNLYWLYRPLDRSIANRSLRREYAVLCSHSLAFD